MRPPVARRGWSRASLTAIKALRLPVSAHVDTNPRTSGSLVRNQPRPFPKGAGAGFSHTRHPSSFEASRGYVNALARVVDEPAKGYPGAPAGGTERVENGSRQS